MLRSYVNYKMAENFSRVTELLTLTLNSVKKLKAFLQVKIDESLVIIRNESFC